MGRIPQGVIDQILDKLDIVEIISEYVQLKKAGRNFKACCPFHNEKTPSFVVSPDKQIFHCFGCNEGGNVIGFVMKHENLSFPEAIEMMAERAGVEIPRTAFAEDASSSLVKRLYEANNTAAEFYQSKLGTVEARAALDYLKGRGLEKETIDVFRVGYAPDGWENLRHYCIKKNIPEDILRKAGLSIKSDKGKNDYDRFRNRIIFPVFNERGNIVAFGARAMGDAMPKYINSPETVIYNKSAVLYGLNSAKTEIRAKGRVIIVEGYMDVVIPYQHGIRNIVAASGTALTSRQVALLKKYTDTAVMVFDSDQAGEAASLRGLDILVSEGMNVYIVTLPEGEDPDSFIRSHGREKFEERLDQAKDLFDYKLDLLMARTSGRGVVERAGIVKEMLPTISKVKNAVMQSAYLEQLASRLDLDETALRAEMSKVRPDYSTVYKEKASAAKKDGVKDFPATEIYLLGLAVLDKKMHERIAGDVNADNFRDENIKKVMLLLDDLYMQETAPSAGKILSRLEEDPPAKEAVLRAIAKVEMIGDKEKVLADCIKRMRKENVVDKLKTLTAKLRCAEQANDQSAVNELLLKISRIHKEKVT